MNRSDKAEQLAVAINSLLAASSSRTVETMRTIRRQYSARLAAAKPELIIRLSLRLLQQPDPHCRFIAYELLTHHKAAFESLKQDQLLKLGRGLDSWSSVDCFACYLTGPIWRDARLPDSLIKDWTRSADRWWRRSALVSTVALSRRGGVDDVRKVLKTCAALVSDRDDMVVKALSWALRELAKKNPDKARQFLADHNANLAARVIREVENKLTTGLKNPRR